MDKISGIVPGSARVKAVDLKNSAPVRPGAPTFGRPVGTSTLVVKNEMTTAEKAVAEQKKLTDARKSDDLKSAIARDLSQKFFHNKNNPADPTVQQPETIAEGSPVNEVEDITQPETIRAESTVHLEGPEADDLDAPEVGRFLDVRA